MMPSLRTTSQPRDPRIARLDQNRGARSRSCSDTQDSECPDLQRRQAPASGPEAVLRSSRGRLVVGFNDSRTGTRVLPRLLGCPGAFKDGPTGVRKRAESPVPPPVLLLTPRSPP